MTRRRLRFAVGIALTLSLAGTSLAVASRGHDGNGSLFQARMIGYNEVPSLNTTGHAKLALTVTKLQANRAKRCRMGFRGRDAFPH